MADHYIKSYAFVIDEEHLRLRDFDKIVELAKLKELNLIFHILPEDVQEAQTLIGTELTDLMSANRDFLINRVPFS